MHRRLEDAVAALAVALGHIHRNVGVPQELGRGRRVHVLADETDADARARKDVLAVDLHRQVERSQDPRRRVGGVCRAFDAVQEHGELVASEAGDGVRGSHGDLQPAADLLENLVARRMPEAVVDRLEVVEVDEHHRDLRHPATRAHQRVLDAVGEERPVGELRHGVVERLMRELILESLALADVAAIEHGAAHVLVVEKIGVLHLEPEDRAVAMSDRAFDRVRFVPSRAVGPDQLREKRTVALADQPVETLSLDLAGGIAEHALDRGALIRDDAVHVEDGDEVARMGDEGAESCLALSSMQIGRERRPLDGE